MLLLLCVDLHKCYSIEEDVILAIMAALQPLSGIKVESKWNLVAFKFLIDDSSKKQARYIKTPCIEVSR